MPATRNLVWILALCVLGLVIYVLTGDPEYTVEEGGPVWVPRLASVDPAGISAITIEQGETRLELVREGESWVAASRYGYPADAKRVTTLLEQLGAVAAPQRRGTSATSHADFEVGDAKGMRLEVAGGAPELPITVILGKPDAHDRVFVRSPDDATVWSVTPNLRYTAGLAGDLLIDPWLDLEILAIPEERDIAGFRIVSPEGTIVLERVLEETTTPAPEGETGEPATTAVWKVTAPETFEADPAIVRALRSSVRRIRGTAAADPSLAAEHGLEPPERLLEISFAEGDPVALEVGAEATIDSREGRYARARGDRRVLLLASYTVSNLFKTLDQLRPAEEPTAPVPPPAGEPPMPVVPTPVSPGDGG